MNPVTTHHVFLAWFDGRRQKKAREHENQCKNVCYKVSVILGKIRVVKRTIKLMHSDLWCWIATVRTVTNARTIKNDRTHCCQREERDQWNTMMSANNAVELIGDIVRRHRSRYTSIIITINGAGVPELRTTSARFS